MELSATKILKTLLTHIWIIILCAVLCGVGGYAYSHYNIPPTYTSSMKMMVSSAETITSYSEITAMRRMVNTYVEMLDSRDFYQLIKEDCSLDYTPAQLKNMITFITKEDSEAFTVTVVAASSEECSTIIHSLDSLSGQYVSEKYNQLIITAVESPSTPSESSSTKRNAVLAFLVGMLLSAAIIIICNEFDTRVKSEEDLWQRYDIPILGVVPTFDVKKKGRAKRDVKVEEDIHYEKKD